MRSLSEESCSSSAVRSEATRYPLANLVSKCSGKSIYAKETQSKKRDILQQGENMGGQGTFTSLANAPSLAPAHYSASTFQTKSGSDDGWLFEGYASGSGSNIVHLQLLSSPLKILLVIIRSPNYMSMPQHLLRKANMMPLLNIHPATAFFLESLRSANLIRTLLFQTLGLG
ncbi:unnamed protein product [Ilex paraguariensis]|uniref:Uncharacterized protein n=1 Tax=Ilex paraguariensis TaxID=185542 RepID=A0ABC8USY1_9AQUA